MRKLAAVMALSVAAVALFTGARRRAVAPPPVTLIDPRRSIIVTDLTVLQNFTFQRVLDQLVARSGVPNMSAARLYRQWFDTQNAKPGLAETNAPHCDDFTLDGKPSFNGIVRRCPTPEGALAAQPFAADEYFPMAVANRFDLAPQDGANCGQYRIVFARKTNDRSTFLHIIFEAVLPNPHPEQGLAACRDVASFWANLSAINSPFERRDLIEKFFFDGIGDYGPVVDPANFSGNGNQSGIRTVHLTPPVSPRFYQFRLIKSCSGSDCTLHMTPDVLENQALGAFFDSHDTSDRARAFREMFVSQIGTLAIDDPNLFRLNMPRDYLMVESDPGNGPLPFDYDGPFTRGLSTPEGAEFKAKIDAELQRTGSKLPAVEMTVRAMMQSCVGCHIGNVDVSDPAASFGFTFGILQFDEKTEPGDGGPRFRMSDAMTRTFVPNRAKILRDYLATGTVPVHSN